MGLPTVAEVRERMFELETSIDDVVGEENSKLLASTIAALAGIDAEGAADGLNGEVGRAVLLARDHYCVRYRLPFNPHTAAGVGFLQGVTFAAAARQLVDEAVEAEG